MWSKLIASCPSSSDDVRRTASTRRAHSFHRSLQASQGTRASCDEQRVTTLRSRLAAATASSTVATDTPKTSPSRELLATPSSMNLDSSEVAGMRRRMRRRGTREAAPDPAPPEARVGGAVGASSRTALRLHRRSPDDARAGRSSAAWNPPDTYVCRGGTRFNGHDLRSLRARQPRREKFTRVRGRSASHASCGTAGRRRRFCGGMRRRSS
jgi:hypothetical protein